MEINDELMACYIDGTATPEECAIVRKYLLRHPEEYEDMLFLMDKDCELHYLDIDPKVTCLKSLQRYDAPINCFGTKTTKDRAYRKPMFASHGIRDVKSVRKQLSSETQKDNGFISRLTQMLNDINDV